MTNDKAAEAREGLLESVTGKAKEVAGAVTGNEELVEEGQLQQAEALNRKEAAAYEAIADAERTLAADELRKSSREADAQKQAAHDAAAWEQAHVKKQRDSEYLAAARDGERQQVQGDKAARAHADEVAEAGLREAAAIAEEADATEQEAQAEKSRLEREAAAAEEHAAQLRDQAQS
jgi:uncharacterized protein YjbJ (UPF0337 family)